MIPPINVPPAPAIYQEAPPQSTTTQAFMQSAAQKGFKITLDGSPIEDLANVVIDIGESFGEVKKRKDETKELGELNTALSQSSQSGFSGGDSGSETTIGEQIALVQQVKNDLEDFCIQIEKHKNNLGSSFYKYKRQGIPLDVADKYETPHYKALEIAIENINKDIYSAHYKYFDKVIAGLYELMD